MKTELTGKIEFEVENKTKKHHNQSSWKKMVMIMIDGDIAEYYAWFIESRYNLVLNSPLRGAHVSLVNDSIKELSCGDTKTIDEINKTWELVKNKWDKKIIPIYLDIDTCTDGKHWWLRVSHDERDLMHGIRSELGLSKPFFDLHMTIGYANEIHEEHSEYIHALVNSQSESEFNKISSERSLLLLDREKYRKSTKKYKR